MAVPKITMPAVTRPEIQIYEDLLQGTWDRANPRKGRDQWDAILASDPDLAKAVPSRTGPARKKYDSGSEWRWDYDDWRDSVSSFRETYGDEVWRAYHMAENEASYEAAADVASSSDRWKKAMGIIGLSAAVLPSILGGSAAAAGSTAGTAAGATGAAGAGALTGVSLPASAVMGGAPGSAIAAASGAAAAGAGGAGAALSPVALPAQAVINGAAGSAVRAAAAGAGSTVASSLPSWVRPAMQGGAALISGYRGAEAAEDATNAMVQSNREAIDFARESRDMALELSEPYREASLGAIDQMQQMTTPGSGYDVTQDPGYQFVLDEGMRALENSAAARSQIGSGGFARQALRYAEGVASQQYGQIFDRLAVLAGYNPIGAQMETALNYGTNAANITSDTGVARASGYIAQENSWQNAIDQLAQIDWAGMGKKALNYGV